MAEIDPRTYINKGTALKDILDMAFEESDTPLEERVETYCQQHPEHADVYADLIRQYSTNPQVLADGGYGVPSEVAKTVRNMLDLSINDHQAKQAADEMLFKQRIVAFQNRR